METKSKNISLKLILIIMTIGIWAVVLQNAGIIPTKQNVYVKGGYVDVSGSVDVDNTVDVSGSVDVNNTVDVDIVQINGYNAQTYGDGLLGVYDPY